MDSAEQSIFKYQPRRWHDALPFFLTGAIFGGTFVACSVGAWATGAIFIVADLRAWWLAEVVSLIVSPVLVVFPRLAGPTRASGNHAARGARWVMALLSGLLLMFLIFGAIFEARRMDLGIVFIVELLWFFALELWNAVRSPVDPEDAILQAMGQGLVALFACIASLFLLLPLQIVWMLFAVAYDWFGSIENWREVPPILSFGLAFFLARGLMELWVDRAAIRRKTI